MTIEPLPMNDCGIKNTINSSLTLVSLSLSLFAINGCFCDFLSLSLFLSLYVTRRTLWHHNFPSLLTNLNLIN